METWFESVLDGEFDLSMRLVTLLNPYFSEYGGNSFKGDSVCAQNDSFQIH